MSEIASLPIDEQLRVVQAIGGRMPQVAGTALSDRQRAELDRRLADCRDHPASASTDSQLGKQIGDART